MRRQQSLEMVGYFIECAELALSLGGEVSFEWPRDCAGWCQKILIEFIHRNNLVSCPVDGCACGMVDKSGDPILKKWMFVTSCRRLGVNLKQLRCKHPPGFKHGKIQGSTTKSTEEYPLFLCRTYLSASFGFHNFCPAMPCQVCACSATPSPVSYTHLTLPTILLV